MKYRYINVIPSKNLLHFELVANNHLSEEIQRYLKENLTDYILKHKYYNESRGFNIKVTIGNELLRVSTKGVTTHRLNKITTDIDFIDSIFEDMKMNNFIK